MPAQIFRIFFNVVFLPSHRSVGRSVNLSLTVLSACVLLIALFTQVPQLLGHPFIAPVVDSKRNFVPFFLDNDSSSIGSSASYASSSRNPKTTLGGLGRSSSQASISATHHTETSVSSQQTFRPAFLEEAPMIIGREDELRQLLQVLCMNFVDPILSMPDSHIRLTAGSCKSAR